MQAKALNAQDYDVHPCAASITYDAETKQARITYRHQVRRHVCIICHEYFPGPWHYDPLALENLKRSL
jgi:hypothetical protein